MKITPNSLIPGLILLLIGSAITVLVDDYKDDGNNQVWLLSHKSIYLIVVIVLMLGLLTFLYIYLREHSSTNKLSGIDPDIPKINRQRRKYIKSLNTKEKQVLNQFSPTFLIPIYLECTSTLETLCKKDILKYPIGYGHNKLTNQSFSTYELHSWAINYLLRHPKLLK